MADEVTLYMRLEYAGLLAYADMLTASGLTLDSTDDIYSHAVRAIGTTTAKLLYDNIIPGQWIIAVNHSTTATISIRAGVSTTDMVELQPGEPCCFRLASGSVPYATSDEASTTVELLALNDTFTWSGTFPVIASDSAGICEFLGTNGDVSVDIGCVTHLWQADATPCLDVGTLATVSHDLAEISGVSVTTDADYGQGSRNVLAYDSETARMDAPSAASPSNRVPTNMDGTTSFIIGGIMQIDSFPGADVIRTIVTHYNTAANLGWSVATRKSGGDTLKIELTTIQTASVTTTVWTVNAITFGAPFAFIANLDVAAGKLKIMTSVAGSYAETAWSDGGNFDAIDESFRVGDHTEATLSGWTGIWAQVFVLEYAYTLDAELSYANMERFLKYSDGLLTV
jgi:hypothetical protein